MSNKDRDPAVPEAGEQVAPRRHDSGSGANETVDGLDATTEELRHAAEDMPSGAGPGKIDKTPVFDRADLAPKISNETRFFRTLIRPLRGCDIKLHGGRNISRSA
jgi:hypothetical protein